MWTSYSWVDTLLLERHSCRPFRGIISQFTFELLLPLLSSATSWLSWDWIASTHKCSGNSSWALVTWANIWLLGRKGPNLLSVCLVSRWWACVSVFPDAVGVGGGVCMLGWGEELNPCGGRLLLCWAEERRELGLFPDLSSKGLCTLGGPAWDLAVVWHLSVKWE